MTIWLMAPPLAPSDQSSSGATWSLRTSTEEWPPTVIPSSTCCRLGSPPDMLIGVAHAWPATTDDASSNVIFLYIVRLSLQSLLLYTGGGHNAARPCAGKVQARCHTVPNAHVSLVTAVTGAAICDAVALLSGAQPVFRNIEGRRERLSESLVSILATRTPWCVPDLCHTSAQESFSSSHLASGRGL